MHEEDLLEQMARGDPDAAEELIGRYYPEILRYCLWHTPDTSLAEDAAQEIFLKVIRYAARYRNQGTFKAFLYQIAKNTCIDLSRKRWQSDLPLEQAEVWLCGEGGVDAVETDLTLRQMVQTLPEGQREIVLLRFSQDLTIREIAQVLDLPLRTVQSRLRSALKKLKTEWKGESR